MGLDSYLTCNSKEVTKAAWGDEDVYPWRPADGQCCYWRKANAIHGWFVDHIQDGADDCEIYEVSVEHLEELLRDVREVIADHSKAASLIPTRSGFFFGSTDYGDYYYEQLAYTRDHLERILGAIEEVMHPMFKFDQKESYFTDWMPKGETDWVVKFQYYSSW